MFRLKRQWKLRSGELKKKDRLRWVASCAKASEVNCRSLKHCSVGVCLRCYVVCDIALLWLQSIEKIYHIGSVERKCVHSTGLIYGLACVYFAAAVSLLSTAIKTILIIRTTFTDFGWSTSCLCLYCCCIITLQTHWITVLSNCITKIGYG